MSERNGPEVGLIGFVLLLLLAEFLDTMRIKFPLTLSNSHSTKCVQKK